MEQTARMEYENTMVSRMFKVKRHQIEMLRDRGYTLDTFDQDVLALPPGPASVPEFLELIVGEDGQPDWDALNQIYEKGEEDRVLVYFPRVREADRLAGKATVNNTVSMMTQNEVSHAILITSGNLSPQARNDLKRGILNIEHFRYNELDHNVTKHIWVPKHTALTDEEKQDFLDSSQIRLEDMPRMSRDDPVVKYYGIFPGTIVRIDRINLIGNSMVAEYPAFRVVSNSSIFD